MFKDFALFLVIIVLITENVAGPTGKNLVAKHSAKLPPRKNIKKLKNNSTKGNYAVKDTTKKLVRRTRTPQYFTSLGQQNGIRLSPLAVPYTPRFTGSLGVGPSSGLSLQQMQQIQQLQQLQQIQQLRQLGQLRSLVPPLQQRINTAMTPNLTPYQLQLARVLPLLNLYRTKQALKGNPTGYAVNRLKYDSIPLKPSLGGQTLAADRLGLLMGLGGYGANPFGGAGVQRNDGSDMDSEGKDTNIRSI